MIVKPQNEVKLVPDIMDTKYISRKRHQWGGGGPVETGSIRNERLKWPTDLSFTNTFRGTKSATDNSADYGLSQAAFMKNRETRWSALIPEEELDPDGNILMENVLLGWEPVMEWQLGHATSHLASSVCRLTRNFQTDFYMSKKMQWYKMANIGSTLLMIPQAHVR